MSCTIPPNAYILIIGAMKCGTSSLYHYLQGHAEICPARTKEPEFFSEHQKHGVRIQKYADLWDFNPASHRYVMEASTGYTKYPMEPNVPQKIYEYGIQPKFIYLMRNPCDRISSHFQYMQRIDVTWLLRTEYTHLINTSNYFLQLAQYQAYFPKESILLLDFDNLKTNPEQVLRTTYDFLGLSHSYFPKTYGIENPTRRETTLEKGMKHLKLDKLLKHAPVRLRKWGNHLLQQTAPPAKHALTDEAKAFIHQELQHDMLKLYHTYGFDVRKWGFDLDTGS